MKFDFLIKKVTNSSLILSSISNDYAAYKWFLFLVNSPQIKLQLSSYEKKASAQYLIIKILTISQILLYLGFIISAFYIYANKQYFVVWILLLFINQCLFIFKKKYLLGLVSLLLARDFPDGTIENKTLYQLSEEYSKKLSIASIVDTIYASQAALKATFAISCFVVLFIFEFEIWACFSFVILSLVVVFFIVNSLPVYKRLE